MAGCEYLATQCVDEAKCSQSHSLCTFDINMKSGKIHVQNGRHLGVKEGRAAVGRHPNFASKACQVARSLQLLHSTTLSEWPL